MTNFEPTPPNSPETQVKDKERFMRTVQSAMTLVNKHPKAKSSNDEHGKPVIKTLSDVVELPQGKALVYIKIGPSSDPKHSNQPHTNITVSNWFDTFSEIGTVKVKHDRVTRLDYFGDGTIGVWYGDSAEEIDEEAEDYLNGVKQSDDEKPRDVSYFEMPVETMAHDIDPPTHPDLAGLGPYDDWDHVEGVEEAVEALTLQSGL